MASPSQIIHFYTTPRFDSDVVEGRRVFLPWYGNRPGTDHQTYFQDGAESTIDGKLQVVTLGANTVALSDDEQAWYIRYRFGCNRFDRTDRTWTLNGQIFTIWERNPRD